MKWYLMIQVVGYWNLCAYRRTSEQCSELLSTRYVKCCMKLVVNLRTEKSSAELWAESVITSSLRGGNLMGNLKRRRCERFVTDWALTSWFCRLGSSEMGGLVWEFMERSWLVIVFVFIMYRELSLNSQFLHGSSAEHGLDINKASTCCRYLLIQAAVLISQWWGNF